jgi:hypothetical protein
MILAPFMSVLTSLGGSPFTPDFTHFSRENLHFGAILLLFTDGYAKLKTLEWWGLFLSVVGWSLYRRAVPDGKNKAKQSH